MKSELGPPATLGSSAAAGVRLVVWCKDCSHQVEPDPAEQAGALPDGRYSYLEELAARCEEDSAFKACP